MGKLEKLYAHILMRRSDANVPFETLRALLRRLGFDERIKGDHHIFTQPATQRWEGETVPGQTSQGCDLEISPSYWRMTMDKKYEIIIFWSSEDNAYVAEVPELAGCMADGKTYREALGNAEQIIEEWIETATKLGRPIPQPRGRLAYA